MLRFVTLTGADDSVRDPNLLAEFSREFEFVEWGILIGSGTDRETTGNHRFPSLGWIDWLAEVKARNPAINLSLHVCGDPLRQVIAGRPEFLIGLGEILKAFGRTQLNFHGETQAFGTDRRIADSFDELKAAGWEPEIIFQFDGRNNGLWKTAGARGHKCAGLYDRSHGAGVVPDEWPPATDELPEGYAGGLGPENVVEELKRILRASDSDSNCTLWIDMETKLFDEAGEFSLGICRQVVENLCAADREYPQGWVFGDNQP